MTPIRPLAFAESTRTPTSATTGNMGFVASMVASGITDIATTFINAQRTKRTYEFNARMAELQGRMNKIAANKAIADIRYKAKGLFSTQRAIYAKAGVKMEGSPAEVQMESLKNSELDVIYTGINAEYQTSLQRTQAGIYRMEGASAMRDVIPKVGKTLLTMGSEYALYNDPNYGKLALNYYLRKGTY